MTLDEFGKFLNRTLFLSLDRISGARLVRIVYILGLAVAVIWGLDHFFATFRASFWDGLWGLLEIAVFGLFGITVLRMFCEALIVYFEANSDAVRAANQHEAQTSLIDEVRDAIEQLGEEEEGKKPVAELQAAKPARPAKPAALDAKKPAVRRTPRTAKRSPKPKTVDSDV
jgi:hypothetical protein